MSERPPTPISLSAADVVGNIRMRRNSQTEWSRRLVRENHPDRLVAQGMPQEFIEIANEKLATINDAYERIRKMRGFS